MWGGPETVKIFLENTNRQTELITVESLSFKGRETVFTPWVMCFKRGPDICSLNTKESVLLTPKIGKVWKRSRVFPG